MGSKEPGVEPAHLRVGVFPPPQVSQGPPKALSEYLQRVEAAGLDHICCGDHVSFYVGYGSDGLITAASYAAMTDEIPVAVGIYLLVLRHPVTVARQISTFEYMFPGRLVFGVGIGGEDRHEVEICGVDPRSRGRRMDECLQILRGLLQGKAVSFEGEFFEIEDALVLPAPKQVPPILVGGRSDGALRRTAVFGDGWLPIWVSARRFAGATASISELAAEAGRKDFNFSHGLQVWCAVGESRNDARARLAGAMQGLYRIPFERFEKWSPYGSPEEIAEALFPYVEAGCKYFNLTLQAPDEVAQVEAAAAIRNALVDAAKAAR